MAKQTHSFATPAPQALTALSIAYFILFGLLTPAGSLADLYANLLQE